MKLVFFICKSKGFGERLIRHRGGIRTKMNPALDCQAYRCKSAAEFEDLQEEVAKRGSGLWCAVRIETPDGRLLPACDVIGPVEAVSLPENTLQKPQDGQAAKSSGSYPEAGGSSPPPATTLPENPPAQDSPPPPPADLPARILEAVKERPRKVAELAAALGHTTQDIKNAIGTNPELKAKQGGWVGLADTE